MRDVIRIGMGLGLLVGATLIAGGVGGCAVTSRPAERDLSLAANEALLEEDVSAYVRRHYVKSEHRVPMRDGVALHTTVYAPRDTATSYPFLMIRTPYSSRPYGAEEYTGRLLPHRLAWEEGFIFVVQDVRGAFMSEGEFENMRPHDPDKQTNEDVDESSDTYDTIQWLLENVPNHNGRVGQWGISYPGFYTAAGMIDAHPALKAVSPQAPIADWYFDDFYHHGAFFLPHFFNFFASFGLAREGLTTEWNERFDHGTPDGYQFFLDLGPLRNVDEKYYKGEVAFWQDVIEHPTRDEFWQARDITPHLHELPPAVLTVGGWYDAEDLYGPLAIYRSAEEKNPAIDNMLVMGPWAHGGWARGSGERLGNVQFGQGVSDFFNTQVLLPFWRHHLKDGPDPNLPEALIYQTGQNQWRRFEAWPPDGREMRELFLLPGGDLEDEPLATGQTLAYDEYISDPAKPVPYSETINTGMARPYMTDDQRFAARRTDVVTYTTPPLERDVTIAGSINADLWVSTSGTDSDFVVKLIDIHPPDAEDFEDMQDHLRRGNYHQMVRSEAFRGRYRNSYEHPEPFVPNEPTNLVVPLLDVLHTFKKGHRIQIQIQSTWFPIMDRNPQKYVENIFFAEEEDFIKATQRIYGTESFPSKITFGVIDALDAEAQANADAAAP